MISICTITRITTISNVFWNNGKLHYSQFSQSAIVIVQIGI